VERRSNHWPSRRTDHGFGRKPEHIRMDNGPELTSHAPADRAGLGSVGTVFIEPGAPWENGYCESFNGRSCIKIFSA
jgi:IS30 family transposase